ncbi:MULTISPECIES: acyl-CoA dehydrogenase family protein [unclassified Frankia]|uniref:acyl-CoA dehydrogenase family protein n=1 Tax=unclassified Frankia TaxID=2632575 RepID=UPI00200D4E1C|nr:MULTISPECIES: acyl-CoA dehydrogenase family protein [unclassified Frankia]MCK9896326.1 acyl-CoA dehydrogenase family protein [Frankia sp. AgB32]MCL9794588.1 acyl-CoA dehydrogenase family protein [Frankia sp. AgKG'84/4]
MSTTGTESLAHFRERARAFVRAHLGPARESMASGLRGGRSDADELAAVARDQEIQRLLADAGLAGICFPREYGGQGLTPEHQAVLNEELRGYEHPMRLQSPSIAQCAAVLLEFGTEEQKKQHLPAILRGDELWMQFLSEPSGGSDVAGAVTTAVREGDEWVLNGSKIWTTGAWWSNWALCLARTNWDVPKHRGLTVFMFPIDLPGIDVHRIELVSGSREFCQEFLTDVRIPDTYRIGEVDGGWSVGVRWLYHERLGMSSPYATHGGGGHGSDTGSLLALAQATGRGDDPLARDLVGEAYTLAVTGRALADRLAAAMASGRVSDQSAAVGRLFHAVANERTTSIAFELVGPDGAAWDAGDPATADIGTGFLIRQVGSIGGGTSEMARNVISERVLGMPREPALDRQIPFREVRRG